MCEATSLDEGMCVGAITFKRRLNAACRCPFCTVSVWATSAMNRSTATDSALPSTPLRKVQEALAPIVQPAWRVQQLGQV